MVTLSAEDQAKVIDDLMAVLRLSGLNNTQAADILGRTILYLGYTKGLGEA